MPWLAQHQGGHPHYADAGSALETIYRRLGYVDVPAPGAGPTGDDVELEERFADTLGEADDEAAPPHV